jgi:hypothetical protein
VPYCETHKSEQLCHGVVFYAAQITHLHKLLN